MTCSWFGFGFGFSLFLGSRLILKYYHVFLLCGISCITAVTVRAPLACNIAVAVAVAASESDKSTLNSNILWLLLSNNREIDDVLSRCHAIVGCEKNEKDPICQWQIRVQPSCEMAYNGSLTRDGLQWDPHARDGLQWDPRARWLTMGPSHEMTQLTMGPSVPVQFCQSSSPAGWVGPKKQNQTSDTTCIHGNQMNLCDSHDDRIPTSFRDLNSVPPEKHPQTTSCLTTIPLASHYNGHKPPNSNDA